MILRTPSLAGVVALFDGTVGLGVVASDRAEDPSFPFHCVAISDGSRDIAVGTRVHFDVVAGPLGRWEAASIRPD